MGEDRDMIKVLLRAPLLSLSGYGIHSRQIFSWLESLENIDLRVEILKWGLTSWLIDPDIDSGIVGRIMSRSGEIKKGEYDVSFQVQLPDEWDTSIAKRNVGVTAAVETDRCYGKWIDKCNDMDMIIVPSTFTKSVLKRSGAIIKPIEVIPEWFSEDIKKPNGKNKDSKSRINLKLPCSKNFLMIGTITSKNPEDDRKNMFYSLKWFCEEFKDNKNVGLVIKCSYGKGTKIDRELTESTLRQVISEVREGAFPKVTLVHGNMTSSEIASLYRHPKIIGYVSATKGEGYGLPIIEAAASGLPVIATGWSGHMDFMDKEFFIPVDYTLKQINPSRVDSRIFMEGSKWAEVNENSFKRSLRKLKDNVEDYNQKALKLQSKLHSDFSKDAIVKKYNLFFNHIYE